jgi:hypothetical protein
MAIQVYDNNSAMRLVEDLSRCLIAGMELPSASTLQTMGHIALDLHIE